ncbi:glutamine synthetase [Gudongella sp. DL1XJH-153]|uniref:glutamine synthetase n=1 Tax=Gudongella sp. DL1XJH-153 TaxID=3409804 RepID=UPI003BB4DBA1
MRKDLCYLIRHENHNKEDLYRILEDNPQIRFVSLGGVDLIGHETEEKIPVKVFMEDMDLFLDGIAVQTDGSSVYLPKIASLDNAKIDMKSDLEANWFVDYNFENIDQDSGRPVGTLKIPCFLYHDGIPVDSRHILKDATSYFESHIEELLKNNPEQTKAYGFLPDEIKSVHVTAATELEFWVRTPDSNRELQELTTSQELNEQYWAKTRGAVRTALENSLQFMELYGMEPEMGHKEVGGVKARLQHDGSFSGIMEQLEIDWKYSTAIQTGDNEIFLKNIIKETFRAKGMDVTFLAKPIPGVAGSGEHTHMGVAVELKSGKRINLFHPYKKHYMSPIGYGALMGILKNYEIMNPFITSSNESFKRLKPGFEAPVCIVTSLGRSVEVPSRNRTILIGLIRDENNPLATRFELRSPNPHTNSFLCMSSMLMAMDDGINHVFKENRDEDSLLDELSKTPEDEGIYLQKGRAYRSEVNVFDDYTEKEREDFFGKVPSTVYENIKAFQLYPEKLSILKNGNVFRHSIIESYQSAAINKWFTEIEHRIIPDSIREIRGYKSLHDPANASDLDISNWLAIRDLRIELMKDSLSRTSMFTQIKEAIEKQNYDLASELQKSIYVKMDNLRMLYSLYKKNLLDI